MRKGYMAVVLLVLGLPMSALAEFTPSEHRWSIGYEDGGGVTMRRFLGDKWEVFLGGGPDDYKRDSNTSWLQDPGDGFFEPDNDRISGSKSEQGFVHLGLGRQLFRENRFWLTAIFDVKYMWSNYQYTYRKDYAQSGDHNYENTIGHWMYTQVSVGLRPAFDLTSRVVLMLNFGVYFKAKTETSDRYYERFDEGGNEGSYDDEWVFETTRKHEKTSSAKLYGYSGITSISLMFRF